MCDKEINIENYDRHREVFLAKFATTASYAHLHQII